MNRKVRLAGQVVLITGAGSGIGRAAAIAAAARGMRPVLVGRRQAALHETLSLLPGGAGAASVGWAFACDITVPQQRHDLLAEMTRREGCLDILINNAGAFHMGPLSAMTDATIVETFAVNLAAPSALIRDSLDLLGRAERPVIVNVGSVNGDLPDPEFSVYSAAKSGLRGLSDALRLELAPRGIRVCYIAPRATDTAPPGTAPPGTAPYGDAHDDQGVAGNANVSLDQPEIVAEMLWSAVERGARSACRGPAERCRILLRRLWPGLYDSLCIR